MKLFAGPIVRGAVFLLAAGCTTRPLQADAGGSGSMDYDAGATGDGGAAVDGPCSGRRSFIVTSTLTLAPSPDAGVNDGSLSHVFTMVIDGDGWTAITGSGSYPYLSRLEPAPGGFRLGRQPGLTLNGAGSVHYDNLTFRFDPAGQLLGTANGKVSPPCDLTNAGRGDDVLDRRGRHGPADARVRARRRHDQSVHLVPRARVRAPPGVPGGPAGGGRR